jgi:sialate O-acetylesterase
MSEKLTVIGVTITEGPKDWQVIQRDADGMSSVRIRGTFVTQESNFSVQVRVVDENTNMPVSSALDWNEASTDGDIGAFHISVSIPQGGLYRIETRVRRPEADDRRPLRGDCIHHIGVGDVFLIAGQSNASGTGKGAASDGPMLGVHVFANDERWKLATHPAGGRDGHSSSDHDHGHFSRPQPVAGVCQTRFLENRDSHRPDSDGPRRQSDFHVDQR